MILAVIDTNILVAGLASQKGASYRILQTIAEKKFSPVLTVPLFLEYEDVLTRSDILKLTGFTLEETKDFLDALITFSTCIDQAWFMRRPLLTDSKDEKLVECAVSGYADYLVTFNTKHFVPVKHLFRFQLITPQEFLKILKER